MTQKEEIALLKATIEELKARIAALEARPYGITPSLPIPQTTPSWNQPLPWWANAPMGFRSPYTLTSGATN